MSPTSAITSIAMREALIEAAYRDELARLSESSDELRTSCPPEVALRNWLGGFVAYLTTRPEMAEPLRAVIASGALGTTRAVSDCSRASRRRRRPPSRRGRSGRTWSHWTS
jgi:hypothetical protein